jgi:hypothetical protein
VALEHVCERSDTADMSPNADEDGRGFIGKLLTTTAFQIVGSVIASLVVGVLIGRASEKSGSQFPPPENVQFVVEDSVNGGVWSLTGRVTEKLFEEEDKPPNAVRWLRNGEKVIVRCVQSGTGYQVEENGHETAPWHWYGQLSSEAWIPIAAVEETSKDGSQGVATC